MSARAGGGSAYYAILAKSPEEVDLLYGQGYARYPALFIPRAFWPSKPEGIGIWAAWQFFQSTSGGTPPGSVGEAYWNFHLPGVVIVFLIYGMILSWAGRLMLNYPYSTAVITIYAILVINFGISQPAYRETVFTLVPGLAVLFATGLLRRPVTHYAASVGRVPA
jgi:hypothetical protein